MNLGSLGIGWSARACRCRKKQMANRATSSQVFERLIMRTAAVGQHVFVKKHSAHHPSTSCLKFTMAIKG